MKQSRTVFLLATMVAGGALLVVGVMYAASRYITNEEDSKAAAITCRSIHAAHIVKVQGDKMMPEHTTAKLCDKLTITNQDAVDRLMAFGHHDKHIHYDGVEEKLLLKNQSLTVTLDQAGTFTFHDHLHDEVIGSFTVTK